MKTNQFNVLILLFALCMSIGFGQETDRFQMYHIHEDKVMPSQVEAYEKAAKALADAAKEHNLEGTSWLTSSTSDLRYLYVTPIENLAQLDEWELGPLRDKMGKEAFSEMFSLYKGTFSSHGDYIIRMDKELTYMPTGIDQNPEGEYYRKFYYFYVDPVNNGAMAEAMQGVKDLFASKNSKVHYRVYRSGFGTMETFYMVAVAAKDPVDMAQKSKANRELLGEAAKPAFDKVMALANRMEEITGYVRPELGYIPSSISTKK